ncbi:AAA family ATPase, partial [Arthrobacter sp. TPD3018]
VKAAAEHWLGLTTEQRETTAMFSSGRVARAELNVRIQDGLAAEGALKGEGVVTPVLDKVNVTREELRYAHTYKPGQVIDLRHAMRELGLSPGTYDVLGVDAKGRVQVQIGNRVRTFDPQKISPVDKTDAMQLAQREEIRLHEGDRIRWTQNDKDRGLNNNDIARVVSADPSGIRVEASDGTLHELKAGDPMMERISLAYALNMHAAQGITTDTAIAVMSHKESNLSNQRLFNVTVTRVRDDIQLFTDDREKLTAAIERNEGNKTSALETTGALTIDPDRGAAGTAAKAGAGETFNPSLPPDLDRGPEKVGGEPSADVSQTVERQPPDFKNDPSLAAASLRIGVEKPEIELPYPEKDIGLEL